MYRRASKLFMLFISRKSVLFFDVLKVIFFSRLRLTRIWIKGNNVSELCILGSGPSANDYWDDNIHRKNADLLVMNFQIVDDKVFSEKPVYLVLADNLIFGEKIEYMSTDHVEKLNLVLEVLERVDWNLTVFLPTHFNKVWRGRLSNPAVNLRYINSTPLAGCSKFHFIIFNQGLGCPNVSSVYVLAVYLAIYLDYARISLYGAEHNWMNSCSVNTKGEAFFVLEHADGRKHKRLIRTMADFAKSQFELFRSHETLYAWAEHKNIVIVNKSRNSLLNVYKRTYA